VYVIKKKTMTHERKEQHIKQLAFSIQQGASAYVTDDFTIECPTPQRSGTSTQQKTYALMKARELMDSLPKQENK
tara:strand:- start:926 stop:1150 length:225 start_codon:yes stop_codon:yes gene_type:complete